MDVAVFVALGVLLVALGGLTVATGEASSGQVLAVLAIALGGIGLILRIGWVATLPVSRAAASVHLSPTWDEVDVVKVFGRPGAESRIDLISTARRKVRLQPPVEVSTSTELGPEAGQCSSPNSSATSTATHPTPPDGGQGGGSDDSEGCCIPCNNGVPSMEPAVSASGDPR